MTCHTASTGYQQKHRIDFRFDFHCSLVSLGSTPTYTVVVLYQRRKCAVITHLTSMAACSVERCLCIISG